MCQINGVQEGGEGAMYGHPGLIHQPPTGPSGREDLILVTVGRDVGHSGGSRE